MAYGRATILATEADREREADNLPKDVTGPILMVMMLGVSYTETHIGEEGLTGFGDTSFMGEPRHGSSEIPLRDLLARCVAFALDQGMRAAASASSSAGTTGSPLLDRANGMPRSIRGLLHRRAALGLNRPSVQLGTCTSSTSKPSRGGPMAAQLRANRLETWRGACLTAASNFSLSCAEGRAYGPSLQLAMLRRNWARTAAGAYESGPGSPHSTKRQRGCHPSMEGQMRIASILQPPEAATPSRLLAIEFEGALRLGRPTLRLRFMAATLPPAPAAIPRSRLGGALRPPPTMPPPVSPGIVSTLASSSRALRAVS